jgi:hypothetical protein
MKTDYARQKGIARRYAAAMVIVAAGLTCAAPAAAQ